MITPVTFDRILIAPCGMNCGTCMAYLRSRNKCSGCRSESGYNVNHCASCKIKNCEDLQKTESGFCYDCGHFPCQRLKQIDKRYRTKYHVSFIENLLMIKDAGLKEFLANESRRWTCSVCGSVICVHRNVCLTCMSEF